MIRRCQDTFRQDRCELPTDHDGMHRRGSRTWQFEDPALPEWRKRMDRGLLRAKVMPL